MGARFSVLLTTLAFLTSAPQAAQAARTFVVDVDLGPGADFASIGAAVDAASDGDLVLVRSAPSGEDVEIADKGLRLVAVPGADRPVLGGLAVRRAPAGSHVRVRGFDLVLDTSSELLCESCVGQVWLEDLQVRPDPLASFSGGMQVVDCQAVLFARALLEAPNQNAAEALRVERSNVQLFRSQLTGNDSRDELFYHATPGGPALRIQDNSNVFLSGVTLRGGAGGDILSPICALRGGNGGTALHVSGQSQVELQDTTLHPGPGGTSCGDDGLPGLPVLLEGGTVSAVSGAAYEAHLEPIGVQGRTTTVRLHGRPGDLALLLLSSRTTTATTSALFHGRLLLGAPLRIPASAPVPASGELSIPFTLPRSLAFRTSLHAQGLFLTPPTGFVLSNPTTLEVLGTSPLPADSP